MDFIYYLHVYVVVAENDQQNKTSHVYETINN